MRIGAQSNDLAAAGVVMRRGLEKLQAGDAKGAATDFSTVVNGAQFPNFPMEQRYAAMFLLAVAEAGDSQFEEAMKHIRRAGEIAPGLRDSDYWVELAAISSGSGNIDILADALTTLASSHTDTLNKLDVAFVAQSVRRVAQLGDGKARYQALLEAMIASKYRPPNPFWSGEGIRFALFKIYVEKGDEARARSLAVAFTESDTILLLQIDNRYRAFLPADLTFQKVLDLDITYARALVATHPDKLQGINALVNDLYRSNRIEEAMKIVDEALARIDQAPKDKPPFSDLHDRLNWTLDMRSRLLAKQGRWNEVETAQKKARDVANSNQSDPVSQTINLGDLYYEMGRSRDALDAVKDIDSKRSSPYGMMAAEEVRACAYAQLADAANLAKSLEYMKAHADDGYGPLRSALLCAGDIEGLAKLLITHLDNPDTRASTLADVQTYIPQPHPTDWDKKMAANRDAALARADVRAAIQRYGVINTYPVFPTEN
jgi:tetratricopeptide (TPR) repeat protein